MVRCTFELFNQHSSTNIMVLCTFLCPPHLFLYSNSHELWTLWDVWKAAELRNIFRNEFENPAIGAEHRNI